MAASVAQESPPFPAPEDQEQKNIIDKLAKFVARNGSKFEEMTKEKQKDNQKFSFLFSGEHYNYYKWRVSVEIAQNQTQQHKQNVQQYQQKQVIPGQVPQYGANPQAAIIQQAIVQQSINSAPWQQAQQQAQQQMQTLQQQQQQQQSPATYTYARSLAPAQPPDLNLTDFESLLQKIMESCTKDSISVGKNWIINNNKSPQHCYHITQYLLRRALTPGMQFQHKLHIIYLINDLVHHCARKQSHDLQKAIQDVVVPIFVHTHLEEPPENQQKLTKVLNIWESNNLLEGSYIMQMKAPESSQATVQAALQQHGFAPQYNYQQPVSVSGSEPLQFNPYQQYQQYYQQYPVYQQPPPQYQQADVQAAPQYQQPQADAPPPPHSQFQQPSTDMQPQQVKQEEEEQVENTKNSLEENIEKPGDSEEGEDTQAVSGKGDDSQPQKEEMHDRDINMMGAREAMQHDLYQAKPYQEYHYEEHPPYHGPPPPFQDYPHFPPPFPPPDFTRPPPSYNQIPPGYPEGGYGYHGPPPPFAHPGGPPEEFDYHHPRPVFGEHGPPMLNEYNHGMGNEGYEEEFEEPPPPEPIIPNAMYYELPAGLMAPLVKISDVDYKPIDPADLRLPAPQPPSERLLAAVEAFYSPPSHERPRNSEGWEQSGLFEFYKAKLPFIKERDARAKQDPPQEITQTTSRSRSRSISPVRSPPARSRSRSRSPKRRRSRSPSPPPRRRRSRSRSFSPPRRRRSRSRSRSRSLSPLYPRSSTQRSPSPPPFMPAFETKTLDTRIEESNVGHMLLKKMGWEGAGLGKTEQGIQNPISAGEVRDKFSKYKGVGVSLRGDAFEEYRKNRSYTYNRPRSSRTRGDED